MTSSVHERFVIGVDDTDGAKGGGTGPLVRALAIRIEDEGFGASLGVTRHLLLDTTKVAKTVRNSALALVVETERGLDEVEDYAAAFVRAEAERDADPGVAVLSRHSDMPHILAFGRRCQQEVMKLLDSGRFASEGNVRLRSIGNNQNGTIGALAAAGLRAGGGDGHYIALRGLEAVRGLSTAGKIRVETAIEKVLDEATGEELDRDDAVDAGEGLWPRLDAGEPLLLTVRSEDDRKLWLPIDRNIQP